MSNNFSKEEVVLFEQVCEGFEAALVASKNVKIADINQTAMERSNNVVWKPQPYVLRAQDGVDQTGNFTGKTQLSVPITLGFQKAAPFELSGTELRDALQEGSLAEAAKTALAAEIDVSVMNHAALYGSNVIKRSGACTGYTDIAQISAKLTSLGVPSANRKSFLSPLDYVGAAENLQLGTRSFGNSISDEALRESIVGRLGTLDIYQSDYVPRLAAAAGGAITISTLDAATNYYIPKATTTAITGESSNVDNRFQTVAVSSTTNVKAGDSFNIANVFACHMITKASTGRLKDFRVVAVNTATNTMVITPPIISNQVANGSSEQYQNCIITAKSGTAPITWLNTAEGAMNPFWVKDTMMLVPGRYVVPQSAGTKSMELTTSQGIPLRMTMQTGVDNLATRVRFDVFYGVANLNTEMSGIIQFNQP